MERSQFLLSLLFLGNVAFAAPTKYTTEELREFD